MKIPRRRMAAAIPLTSTADVAFLLLIFFIVLAKGTNESTLELRPAVTTAKLDATDPSMVTVSIDKHSKIYVNGSAVSAAGVRAAVEDHLGTAPPANRKVLLKIDKAVPDRVFGQVMYDVSEADADIWRALDPPEEKK